MSVEAFSRNISYHYQFVEDANPEVTQAFVNSEVFGQVISEARLLHNWLENYYGIEPNPLLKLDDGNNVHFLVKTFKGFDYDIKITPPKEVQ